MGLGDFLSGAGKAAVNVVKAGAYVADPTHLDDIAEGVGKVGSYVAKNPGKTWDTGFEVGRAIAKDQLKPQNLAITAGLVALTAATGGGAAPALAAKLGMGAKSVEAGVTAAKGIEAGTSAIKAATTASRTARFAQDVRGTVTAIKEAKGLSKVDNILNSVTEVRGAAREAAGMSRYGAMATKRAQMAESVAERGGLLGKTSGLVAGSNNAAVQAGNVYSSAARMRTRVNQAQHVLDTPARLEAANQGIEVAADPTKAITTQVNKEINKRAQKSGYTASSSHTGNSFAPLTQPMTVAASGQAQSPFSGGTGSLAPLTVPKANAIPAVGRSKSAFTSGSASAMKQPMSKAKDTMDTALPQVSGEQSTGQQPIGSEVFPTMTSYHPENVVGAGAPTMKKESRTSRRSKMYSAPSMYGSVAGSMGGTLGI